MKSKKKNSKSKDEEYPEYFEQNKYFKLEEGQGNIKKLILTRNIIQSQNLNQIEIFIKNIIGIESIDFISNNNNNISISNKSPYKEEILISDLIIHLKFANVYLLFMENKCIFSKSYSNYNPFYGYLIVPNEENIKEINSMDFKEIIFKFDNFFNSIEKILNLNLVHCKIYYQQFIPQDNFERDQSEKYYEIDAVNNLIKKFEGKSIEESKIEKTVLKNLSIKNILPDFYDCNEFNSKTKKTRKKTNNTSCGSCNIL